ncbi:MAG: hypothetical protein ACI9PP_002008 [Halobacteriales archaeon]|jgi:hypothetical protein
MVSDGTVASIVVIVVTASLPFYLYGAWIVLDAEWVTWKVLKRHLAFIVPGLLLTAIPMLTWMLPRLLRNQRGLAIVHAFIGIQAYALLAFALTGIVRIFQVKWTNDLYEDTPDDVRLSDLHEKADDWRKRLRVGVFGYVVLWLLAWVVGLLQYATVYL